MRSPEPSSRASCAVIGVVSILLGIAHAATLH